MSAVAAAKAKAGAAAKAAAGGEPTTPPEERAHAAAVRHGAGTGTGAGTGGVARAELPPSRIDMDCRQKYVLCEVRGPGADEKRYIVRGSRLASYHVNCAEPLLEELKACEGVEYSVLGGGRIEASSERRTIQVYGHSYGFPWANDEFKHDVAAAVLKLLYPAYLVTTSNEGY